ncbi:hypothetical protein HPB47_017428, partial [Ixodes persulcatus]
MSADQPDFGALITLADVATGGQPLAAPLPPDGYPATGSVGGRLFAPTLASGLSHPGQARRTPDAPSTLEGNAVGDVSGTPSGYSAPSLHPRGSVSQRANSIRARDTVVAPIGANAAGDFIELPSDANKTRRGSASLHLEVIVSPMASRESHLYQTFPHHGGRPETHSGKGPLQEATQIIESLSGAMQAILPGPRGMRSPVYGSLSPIIRARWFRMAGQHALTFQEFRLSFRQEFLPTDYERRMRRELERRTQNPDKLLLKYVRAMQELLPPYPSESLESRCAWNGDVRSRTRCPEAYAAYADTRGRNTRDITDRTLDPYTFGLRRGSTETHAAQRNRDRPSDTKQRSGAQVEHQDAPSERPACRGTCDGTHPTVRTHGASAA